jgi:hypothetical protein
MPAVIIITSSSSARLKKSNGMPSRSSERRAFSRVIRNRPPRDAMAPLARCGCFRPGVSGVLSARLRQLSIIAFGVVAIPLLSGCLAGSLATNTGAQPGGTWSTAQRQPAHVGERVKLSFVLKQALANESMHAAGLADYCVFNLGGEKLDAEIDESGAFTTEYRFDNVTAGERVPISAIAYRQVGPRDRMLIAGEWISNASPNNPSDDPIASAALSLDFYQTQVEIAVPVALDAIDPATAELRFKLREGEDVVVYVAHPPRPGFTLEARDEAHCVVRYQPNGFATQSHGHHGGGVLGVRSHRATLSRFRDAGYAVSVPTVAFSAIFRRL